MKLKAGRLGQIYNADTNRIVSAEDVVTDHTRANDLLTRCVKLLDPRSRIAAQITAHLAAQEGV